MTHIEELGKLLDDFSKLFDRLNDLQQEKIQAVRQDDLSALEHCMQQEQAISLQIRGMQRQKEKLDQALGLKDIPLREISDHLAAADREQLAPTMRRFKESYELYHGAASASRAVLETTLQEINHALQKTDAPKEIPSAIKQGNFFTDIKA